MSKVTQLGIFTVFLFVSGWIYVKYYQPEALKPVAETGHVIEISMHSLRNKWTFAPNEIHAKVGDRVKIEIFNEDNFDHGWALEAFAINRRLFPNQDTLIEFIASKAGTFKFYCSVPCGEGHYQQTGTLVVDE